MVLSEPEKRSEPRVPVPPIPVYASSEDDVFFYGYIKNISPSGMLILSYMECAVGQEYTLQFALPAKPKLVSSVEEQISISCRSSVRWCKQYAMSIHGPVSHGVKIVDAMPDATENIERWVMDQMKG
jgi:PilZ domain